MASYCPGNLGDLLVFDRSIYEHYAVNVGNGDIVHVTSRGDVDSMDGARAGSGSCCSSLGDIAVVKKEPYISFKRQGDKVRVEDGHWNGKTALKRYEIVRRALSRVGERGYNLLFKNCESFARWCRYGEEKSDQATNLQFGLGAVAVAGGAGLLALGVAAYLFGDSEAEEKRKQRNSPNNG